MTILITAMFDADNHCVGVTDGPPPYGDEVVNTAGVPAGTDPNRVWFDGSVAQPREVVDLALPETILVGTPLSVTVPVGSVLYVQGAKVQSPYTHDTSVAGTFLFELRSRHFYRQRVEIIDSDEQAKRTERQNLRAHQIVNATPQQIENYIDNNVTDLASAREFLKVLAKIAIIGLNR